MDRSVPRRRSRHWRWRPWALLLAAVGGLTVIGLMPVETKQGIDYSVSTYTMPLYVKALDFVQRDSSYSRLVQRLVSEQASDESRALTIFDWTRNNIRDTPAGFPIVDDHVWHIIIRGYGTDDQKTDVFTTLTTYAGVPGFWSLTEPPSPELSLSFVWIEGRWRVFDVQNGIVFRNRAGALASAEELAEDRWVLESVAADRTFHEKPYAGYFVGFKPPNPPDILRAELQMLWPRASHRLKGFVGLGRREWQDGR